MKKYFPDVFPEGKGPPREYFYNILNTVHPDFLAQMLAHANKQRMTTEGEKGLKESIQISQFWDEQLKAMPYLSSKYYQRSIPHILSNFREAGQDVAPVEGKIQACPEWT